MMAHHVPPLPPGEVERQARAGVYDIELVVGCGEKATCGGHFFVLFIEYIEPCAAAVLGCSSH